MLNDKKLVKRIRKIGKVKPTEAEKLTAFMKSFQHTIDEVNLDYNIKELLDSWDYNKIKYKGESYYIFTEVEANAFASDGVVKKVDTLPTIFLSRYIPMLYKKDIANKDGYKVEGIDNVLFQLIGENNLITDFIEDSIEEFGRAYFICKDKKEYEEFVNKTLYYIYKMN